MSADAVYTQSGWFNRHAVIIPIARIQVVDTEAGPLEQLLKLATVTVTTASSAGTVRIPDSMRRPPRRWCRRPHHRHCEAHR